ncbi:hypothetical protein [Microbispora hainanensis]|uniref:Uncharacterized protein n=1 Tax=Microbispora hainanensis TaxID=568844 RepID=A0A544YDR7_9ACTN|nr:hypothetical protein [Microbispora hainanensis]TQS14901.1 hypothetical protein FLX08_33630 [Microbispora hainanensis]
MTFPPDDEYGELLRRALRAEADSVVPSPDGLEIIRGRIDQRGLRGLRHLLWRRVGAAAAGAVLVAGAVVMIVPGLRDQVAQSTGISNAGDEREDNRDTSSVTRPPNPAEPSRPVVIVPVTPSPSRERPSPTPTPKTGATTRPSPSPSDPCVTPTLQPGVIEPDTALPPTCSPPSVTQETPVVRPSASRHPSSPPRKTSAPPVTPSTAAPAEAATPEAASPSPSTSP